MAAAGATQLMRAKHAGDMPAKSPTFSALLRLRARTPLCQRGTYPFCEEAAEFRVGPWTTMGGRRPYLLLSNPISRNL
jgi:hypothetical protein